MEQGIGAPLALKAVAHGDAEHENLLPDSRCPNVA
jgi:hypothetical protein